MKRIFALLLCAATLLTSLVFVGCGTTDDEDKGQYITAYLTDTIYDLDPANAYNNEAVSKVVGMLFDTLFKLDENGKVKKSLVDDYIIKENPAQGEYIMQLYIKEDAMWSDGTAVSANDIVFAWQRLLRPENNYEAAALLFDIKNARAAKESDASIDDVRIYPAEQQMLEIHFEAPADGQKVDYDQFLLNLTSLALAPLRDEIVSKGVDWAKKGATMVCSGPFKLGRVNVTAGHPDDETTRYFDSDMYLQETIPEGETTAAVETEPVETEPVETDPTESESGETETSTTQTGVNKHTYAEQRITDFTIERNSYYYRDVEDDAIDKSVTPYRICVDCSLTDEQLVDMYEAGLIMYIGDIPLSLRQNDTIKKNVTVAKKSMSTNTVYLNQNALIENGTDTPEALYANTNVRQALSMAINRAAIAEAAVYAEAATGLVPTGVYAANSKKNTFRDACTETYSTLGYDLDAAKALITSAGLAAAPADYEIELTVAAYDDVHCMIAEKVVAAWQELGFTKAVVKKVGAIKNNDVDKNTGEATADICDDIFSEDFRAGRFEAAIVDYVAYSPDPYSVLAPFAKAFSGRGMDMSDPENYTLPTHMTGYDNETYNALMETIFAEKTVTARVDNLLEAEKILMNDMPVIPLIFNLDATITSDSVKVPVTYYGTPNFRKTSVKRYDEYLDAGYNYLVENFKPNDEQTAAIKAAWKAADPTAEGVDSADINDMILFDTTQSSKMEAAWRLHPMWNLKCLSANGCTYTSWTLLQNANNTVYSHYFLKEKARLAALESEQAAS